MPPEANLKKLLCFDELIEAETAEGYAWPQFDEKTASTICYTSGTTGDPKGVVYSHRAAVLQTMTASSFEFMPGHREGVRG